MKDKKGTSIVNALKKKDFLEATLKCIQHTIKENMLLLRDLLERWKTRFLNT